MTISYSQASDIANFSLEYYMRGPSKAQTIQDKPLLQILQQYEKPFAGGGGASHRITIGVHGSFLSDTVPLQGLTHDTELTFNRSQNLDKASYDWKAQAYNLLISEQELLEGGINVTDDMQASPLSKNELSIITNIMEERVKDFMESWARNKNKMFWQDGSQDALHTPGLMSIITDEGLGDTVGLINSATKTWWHNRCRVGARAYTSGYNALTSPTGPKITASKTDQTLTRFMRAEQRQLRRYGGKPSVLLCGSLFLDALEYEFESKGQYTQTGFNKGTNDIGMAQIAINGIGTFQYDPTLDDFGMSKRCYIFDPAAIYRKPIEGNSDKMRAPTRPAEYLVFLKTITDASALVCERRNCNGVYEVA